MSQLILTLLIVISVGISTGAIASGPDFWELQRTDEVMLSGPQYQQDQWTTLKAEVAKILNQWIPNRSFERGWKINGRKRPLKLRD